LLPSLREDYLTLSFISFLLYRVWWVFLIVWMHFFDFLSIACLLWHSIFEILFQFG
jgi:hypothetical protein